MTHSRSSRLRRNQWSGGWWAKGYDLLRSVAIQPSGDSIVFSSSATINAQIWLNQFPWRPTAGWSVVAGLLSYGLLAGQVRAELSEIVLLLLLADPLWGSIWRMAAGRVELLPLHERDVRRAVWLPYLEEGSPAARLLGGDDNGVLHLLYRVALPTLVLSFAIAFALGRVAMLLTGVVVAVSAIAWLGRHVVRYSPAILHSAVTVALPWILALFYAGLTPESERWWIYMVLVILWFLHNWGEGRCLRSVGDLVGIILLGVGDIGIGILLISIQAPVWLALLSIVWLPTWLTVYQQRSMQYLNFWWLVAMIISGLAVSQMG